MKRLRSLSPTVLVVILVFHLLTISAAAEAPFIDGPHWQEVPAQTVTQMYTNRDSFVVMFFRHTCFNSNLRKTMLGDWMDKYGLDVYGVDCDQYSIPNWVWANIASQSATLPVICIVKDGSASCFTAKDSMRSIQKQLQEYLGVYDGSEIDFNRLNSETFNSYSSHAATAATKYCTSVAEIPVEIRTEVENIVQNASSNRDRLKVIYDWIATNIYYNYGMLNGTVQRRTSALETYRSKNSVCAGYANLTAAMCNAAGIPCRVVTGFATGVDTESTVEDVWRIYGSYLKSGDLDSFAAAIGPYENHAWNEAYIDGKWVILDTTWGSNNDYYPDQRGQIKGDPTDVYFDPALEWFSESHLFWTDHSCDLEVTLSNNKIVVTGTLDTEDIAAASHFLAALYDSNGRLLECSAVTLSGTSISYTVTNPGNIAEVKVFLLNGQYVPAALPYLGKAA